MAATESTSSINLISMMANIASILGFFISIWILIYAKKVKKEITRYMDFREWKKVKAGIKDELSGCLKIITKDDILDQKLAADIIKLISLLETFPYQFGNKNRKTLDNLRKLLEGNIKFSEKRMIIQEIAEIVGKLSREEEFNL